MWCSKTSGDAVGQEGGDPIPQSEFQLGLRVLEQARGGVGDSLVLVLREPRSDSKDTSMGGVAISGVGDDHGLRDKRPGLLELAVVASGDDRKRCGRSCWNRQEPPWLQLQLRL